MKKLDLKSNLRELAARSEQLKEFAMVRDADGRFIEVDEEDGAVFPVGTAVKAGVGAAGLGAAGFGAYKANQGIMNKYGTRGLLENMDSRRLPSVYAKTTAAGTAAASPMQAYRAAATDLGNTISSRASQGYAAGKTAYNAAADRATAAVKPGLGRIGSAIRKGLKVAFRR
jgi:hypothetical protein